MRIGKFLRDGDACWGVVDPTARTVRILAGPFARWAGAVTAGAQSDVLEYLGQPVALDELVLVAPVEPSGRVFGVGSTYRRHVANLRHVLGVATDEEYPKTPGGFIKPHAAIVDPDGEIFYPRTTSQLDFEIELLPVLGLPIADAPPITSVLGYTIGNDVSARDAKSRHGGPDYFSMKCLDHTSPVGPYITTRDELGGDDHPDLELTLTVNGEVRQHDRTSSMAWTIGELLAYVNERVAMAPGDVLFTGTTAGVGWEDGRFLELGDLVEATIEGIGTLRATVAKAN